MNRTYPPITTHERYLTALEGRDPLESMRKAPKRLRKLLKGLSRKQLTRRPAEGKWSIKEVLAHLADGEVVLGARIRMVAAMDRPVIIGYDQDALVERLAYEKVDVEELLANFAAVRAINVALLERLPDDVFAQVGLHNERGEESLATMVFMYAGHDRLHEQQIVRLRSVEGRGKRKAAAPSAAAGALDASAPSDTPQAPSKAEPKRKKAKREKHGKRKSRALAGAS